MKKNIFFTAFGLLCCILMSAQGQSNHPTIQNAFFVYRPVATATITTGPGIIAVPQATVMLKAGADIAKIYLKVSDNTSHAVIYQASYTLTSAPVLLNGMVLFQHAGNMVILATAQQVLVNPHTYELWTEDSQQNTSPVLSLIQ